MLRIYPLYNMVLIFFSLDRWNVKRKWKQAVDFQGLGSDEQLDEAYMDELEQQVLYLYQTFLPQFLPICVSD